MPKPSRPFFNSLITGLLCSAALTAVASAEIARLRLTWNEDPAHRVIIGWEQVSGNAPTVCYGTVDRGADPTQYPMAEFATRRENYMEMDNRFATLTGLEADTAYYFVIRDSEGSSDRFWFRTAPATPKPFTLIAGGDTKSDPAGRERGRRTNRIVGKLRPLCVIFDGDFCSGEGLDPTGWKNWLADWHEDTCSPDGRVYPIVPVRGNHEASSEILYRIFGLESPDNYFAIAIGGDLFRFYALNSEINIVRPGDNRERPTPGFNRQLEWLQNDLAAHPDAKFKVCAYHKPFRPHTSSKAENDYIAKAWAPVFYRYGMNLSIEGDSHMHKITWPVRLDDGAGSSEGFVRDDEKGTMYVGEGSWGAGTRKNDDTKPWTLASGQMNQCKWFHVHPDRIDILTVITEPGDVVNVGANDESDVFAIPANLKLFDNEGHGTIVKYPVGP